MSRQVTVPALLKIYSLEKEKGRGKESSNFKSLHKRTQIRASQSALGYLLVIIILLLELMFSSIED
jgi:hypothetical protein